MKRLIAKVFVTCMACAALAVPGFARGPALAMLDTLDHGAWELRFREKGGPPQRMCIRNGRQLIQLRHANLKCGSVVVEDTPGEVTVQYTCPGQGYGRTNVRRETSRLVQIDSQGIADGVPFAFAAEARWAGNCSG